MNKYKKYISLGFNCEVSFALENLGILEASLFSWADVRGTTALISGLKEPEKIFSKGVTQYSSNMFFCEYSKIGFHGRLNFEDAKKDDGSINDEMINNSLSELVTRLKHLSEKQKKIFEEGSVLVVIKYFADIYEESFTPEESAKAIESALRSIYRTDDFTILLVTEGANDYRNCDTDRIKFRSIANFSPRKNAGNINKYAWLELFKEFMGEDITAEKIKQDQISRAADYWSKPRGVQGTRWWTNPTIISHVNKMICGRPLVGIGAGIHERLKQFTDLLPFKHGISVGVGNGSKEISLVKAGIVASFDLYEISGARIEEGRRLAEKMGVSSHVNFFLDDPIGKPIKSNYDFVYWDSSLHHMLNVSNALQWSRDCLKEGGIFCMHDFIGPSRFQWSDIQLEIASRVRNIFPSHYLVHPLSSKAIPTSLLRPSIVEMIKADPSEAADSSNILLSLGKTFPNAEITMIGGLIYHLALNDIMGNFNHEGDRVILDSLLLLDEILAKNGESLLAVAIAQV